MLEIEFFNQTTSLIIILIFYIHIFFSFIDNSKKSLKNFLHSIAVSQIIMLVGVLYNYVFDPASQMQIAADTIRASTLGLSVNYLASALALNLPVLIYLKKYIKPKIINLILNASIVLSIIGVLLTLSGWSSFPGFFIYFLCWKTIKRLVILPHAWFHP